MQVDTALDRLLQPQARQFGHLAQPVQLFVGFTGGAGHRCQALGQFLQVSGSIDESGAELEQLAAKGCHSLRGQ